MIPAVVLALAQLAPAILPLFTDNKTANDAARVASSVATTVAGTDNLEDAAKAIIGNATLEAEFRSRMLDHVAEMYQAETERLRLDVEDRDSARRMQSETRDPAPKWLAFGFFSIWAFVQVWLLVKGIPAEASEPVIQRALGMLDAIMMTVVAFYFGSSMGSKFKGEWTAPRK